MRTSAALCASVIALGLLAGCASAANDAVDAEPSTPDETAAPSSAPTGLALPTEADIPPNFSDEERASAIAWLTTQQLIDACMDEAGYPEWTYAARWQRGYDPNTNPADWLNAFEPERQEGAKLALWGTNSGAEYDWQQAGCEGYAIYTVDFDNEH